MGVWHKYDGINTRTDLAWVAGILDGEGCLSIRKNWNRKGVIPRITVGQKGPNGQPQMLLRLQRLLGGYIAGPFPSAPQMYTWHLAGFEKVQAVVAAVWTWLGDVKRAAAVKALLAYREYADELNRTGRKGWKRHGVSLA